MTKEEVYINYIVDDLINNTDMDIDTHGIFFHPPYSEDEIPAEFNASYGSHFPKFLKYVEQTYGTREEDVWKVWRLYGDLVLKLMD